MFLSNKLIWIWRHRWPRAWQIRLDNNTIVLMFYQTTRWKWHRSLGRRWIPAKMRCRPAPCHDCDSSHQTHRWWWPCSMKYCLCWGHQRSERSRIWGNSMKRPTIRTNRRCQPGRTRELLEVMSHDNAWKNPYQADQQYRFTAVVIR